MVTMSSIRRALMVLATVSLPLLGTAAFANESASAAAKLRLSLAKFGAIRECPDQCSWCTLADNHKNEAHANSTNAGTEHGCQFSEGGCTDHKCNAEAPSPAAVDQIERLIRVVSASELRDMAKPDGRLRINSQRNSVQVMGCASRVILNVHLSAEQGAELATLSIK